MKETRYQGKLAKSAEAKTLAGPDSRVIRCEWKMEYKMMANTGNSDSTRVHSPLDVFV